MAGKVESAGWLPPVGNLEASVSGLCLGSILQFIGRCAEPSRHLLLPLYEVLASFLLEEENPEVASVSSHPCFHPQP